MTRKASTNAPLIATAMLFKVGETDGTVGGRCAGAIFGLKWYNPDCQVDQHRTYSVAERGPHSIP